MKLTRVIAETKYEHSPWDFSNTWSHITQCTKSPGEKKKYPACEESQKYQLECENRINKHQH